ncbi:MAG: SEC-C domain-containing protein, partial [Clostridia bacterium]|nr:SEC-C domain-containing protein [Clostridia bacterium]
AGGLYIIGTERHESRRIDNQLRGRAGRQGDPGISKFFISLEDDLMRLFGSDRVKAMVDALGLEETDAIENKMLTNAIENAQKRVEGRNFDIRKHVLQYDDVMNQQRNVIYTQRQRVLNGESIKDYVYKMIEDLTDEAILRFTGEDDDPDNWSIQGLLEYLGGIYLPAEGLGVSEEEIKEMSKSHLRDTLVETAKEYYEKREAEFGEETMREIERVALLRVVDSKWIEHIDAMEQLKSGINLRAYGQRDPVVEYKFEGYDMFEEMISLIREDTLKLIYRARVEKPVERVQVAKPLETMGDGSVSKTTRKANDKVGRNDLCPCGSGKKYKKCCGANQE